MSSDAPSERREPVKRRKPETRTADSFFSGKGSGKSSRRADNIGGKSWEEAKRDLDQLRSAFRPPEPDSLKERLRKMLRPPYIPFTSVLLAALSFTLILSYAESWGRGQSRTIHSQQAPGPADRSGAVPASPSHRTAQSPE